jgi:hypothetical protein
MYPHFGMIGSAIFLIFMLYWCKEVFQRFGKDLADLCGDTDLLNKGIIVGIWIITVVWIFEIILTCHGWIKRISQYL